MITSAFVKLWGETVGAIVWNASSGIAAFEYDSKFLSKGIEPSPLKMPLGNGVFSFPELRQQRNSQFDTFKGLPGLIADALPDRYGNQLINSWLAQNGRTPDSMNPVEILCFVGSRGMGALEFEPVQHLESASFDIEIDSLVETAKNLLSNREDFSTNLRNDQKESLLQLLKIGTSAGGARPKAVIAYNEMTGEVKSGQTIVPDGFEHWLLKLDGVSDVQLGQTSGYGRVEMAYYEMALACGIEMMPSLLLEENGRAHFMTKRFDREPGNIKHHIQTFCAMKHFDYNEVTSFSYEQLFQTMRELRCTYPEAEELFRRMVFNVLARNCDDHTKNFSFRLKKGGRWELAPAYDLCHAFRPGSQWVSQHALSVNGKRNNITEADLLSVAKEMNIKKASEIIEHINSVVENWKVYAEKVEVDSRLSDAIAETLVHF